ncbi:hypothetical protein [Stackebrandtia nassauensis]|uniref:Uncharacterized protein n=1 Tax=Stackebrandtia nassauensis (strain DSM 44728 / CIP 108903 / NRRL B-16338 / NBRC 102104 / LLR-40K-21) TaxID=446470 RepID=D3PWA7_STANL|nr:hypothetical protein [Stackebrandtia nassauensis]ADD41264.1 hypothetical protein Snas_1561 [Stackebrandtia nassauensis DSM 44728]
MSECLNIAYLPRGTGEPQRFRYAFGLGPGLELTGVGSSTGDRHLPDGTAVSALRFRADQRLSRRLRLWLETGRSPARLLWRAVGELATRCAVAGLAV